MNRLLPLLLAPALLSAQPPAKPVEVTERSVSELQSDLSTGRTSSVALTKAYLARIAAYEQQGPALNALIRLNPRALAEAAQRDAERKAGTVRGPMHGIPVIIKDNYDTGDMPTSAGSLALASSQPARDGFVVQRLREAGAIILAKSNLHELAAGITSISSLGGQTRNPYDPTRCPGGSSGGTGAAIAASFAAVGWGSDTCGSIRYPSAYASLFGLRPTMGMVSRTGIVPLSHTQDIGGPLARTATDLAIALDVTVGYDSADATTRALRDTPRPQFQQALKKDALRGARIGVLRPYFVDADAEIADTVRSALRAMQGQGAVLVELPLAEFDTLIAGTSAINLETKFDLADYLRTVPNAPVHTLREILDRGLFDKQLEARFRTIDTMPAADSPAHTRVLRRQEALRARIARVMDSLSLDALAYPSIKQKPVLIGEVQLGGNCALAAQTGLPAISIPAGFTVDGLPVGLELMGRAMTDVRLVAMAYAFEQSGVRRQAPVTTPALVAGRSPAPVVKTVVTRGEGVTATTVITWDPVQNQLRWSATLAGPRAARVSALVLRREGGGTVGGAISGTATGTVAASVAAPAGSLRVVSRLLGPGMARGSGVLQLNALERSALLSGSLRLGVHRGDSAALQETKIPAPR